MVMVNYNTNNLEVDEVLRALCERKISTLQKFFQKYEEVSVDVEFHKDGASNAGKQYRVNVNLNLDGQNYHASAVEESYEQAIDEVRNELDKELRRAHDKKTGLIKRGGRAVKNMLRFGRG